MGIIVVSVVSDYTFMYKKDLSMVKQICPFFAENFTRDAGPKTTRGVGPTS